MFFLKFTKKLKKNPLIEPILLFLVFFFPGFLKQGGSQNGEIFNSVSFNLLYMITVIPQIFLLLYIIDRKGPGSFKKYGITPITAEDVWKSFLYYTGVTLLLISLYILLSLSSAFIPDFDGKAIQTITWKINTPRILPLVFLTAVTIGYSEELFFRSYLLTELINYTGSRRSSILAGSLLFSIGHIYQGAGGFLSSFIIGIYFSHLFLKRKRIHSIALGHALYNFSVLVLSIFLS